MIPPEDMESRCSVQWLCPWNTNIPDTREETKTETCVPASTVSFCTEKYGKYTCFSLTCIGSSLMNVIYAKNGSTVGCMERIVTEYKFHGTIWHSMGNILRMHVSINFIPQNNSKKVLSTSSNLVRAKNGSCAFEYREDPFYLHFFWVAVRGLGWSTVCICEC